MNFLFNLLEFNLKSYLYCSITVKTSSQSKEEKAHKDFLNGSSDEQDKESINEDSKRMAI